LGRFAAPVGYLPGMSNADAQLVLPPRLVLYDGVCGFCDGAVRWLLARDRGRRLHFAPLQGDTAEALRRRHPELPQDVDTLVYVETGADGERVHLRSEAVFRVLAELAGPWRHLVVLRRLPRRLTDAGYRLFARHRYRLFGKLDECAVPEPEERARFVA
jgi:predicted DCC family thiol-disulfide oxidoreductase YuxK